MVDQRDDGVIQTTVCLQISSNFQVRTNAVDLPPQHFCVSTPERTHFSIYFLMVGIRFGVLPTALPGV